MSKLLRLILIFILVIVALFAFSACSASGKLLSIEVDISTLDDYYDISTFSLSKINVILNYENEETETVPLVLNMIKAEDHPKLQVIGDHTITIIHRQVATTFTLRLRDIIDRYAVKFLNEDGTQLGDTQFIIPGGTAHPPVVPPKADYVFEGWIDQWGNYSFYDNIQEDKIFRAAFAPDYYTIRFILETGGMISEIRIRRGDSAESVAPDFPVIPGKTAIGWNKDLKNITEDTTIIAMYIDDTINASYVYGFDGSSKKTVNYTVYTEISPNFSPLVDHAEFLGWYTNKEFTGPKVGFPYLLTNEITFYAKYVSRTKGSDGLEFSDTGHNTYTISKYLGNDEIIVIPERYNTLEVVGVENKAFINSNNTRFSVTGSNRYFSTTDGVLFDKAKETLLAYPTKKIDTQYILPSGVKRIEDYAFANAKNLLSINFPADESLTSIGDYAFNNCSKLIGVEIPASVEVIGERAFYMEELSQLRNLTFGHESILQQIGKEAFRGLTAITTITLPSIRLEYVGSSIFYDCLDLREILLEGGEISSYFRTQNGVLYDYALTTLIAYPPNNTRNNNAAFTVIDGVNSIKAGAFNNANIVGITLPASIERMESNALNSAKLQYVQFLGEQQPEEISDVVFGVEISPAFVIVPQGRQAYFPFFSNMQFIEDAIGVIYYYNSAGYLYTKNSENQLSILGLRRPTNNLVIPSQIDDLDVASIGKYAFYNNQTIRNITLSEGILEIDEFAFAYSRELAEVILPSSLKSIKDGAFGDCTKLHTVIAQPDILLESLGSESFFGTLWYEESNEEFLIIGDVLIKYNGQGQSAELPSHIRVIADSAFVDKKNLKKVTLNGGLEKIKNYAFYGCSSLIYIEIPASVNEIGDFAFAYCPNLYRIIMKSQQPPMLSPTAFSIDAVHSVGNVEYNFGIVVPYNLNAIYLNNYLANEQWREYDFVHINERSITFDSTPNPLQTIIVNTIYEPIQPLERVGYVFGGWYFHNNRLEQLETDPIVFPLQVEDERPFYIRWFAENEGVSGIEYLSIKNGTEYAVSRYSGSLNFVVIPNSYKGKPVTTILKNAFAVSANSNNAEVYNIILPKTITTIEEGAFVDTKWYKQVLGEFIYMNDTLIEYRGRASYVEVPSFITKIVPGAFRANDGIKSIKFPDDISILPEELMYNCVNLEQIVLPLNIKEIKQRAFMNCVKLNFAQFPYLLEKVAADALLNTYWYNNFVDDIVTVNNILYKYKGNQSTLHIPNTILKIEEEAFRDNIFLVHLYISNTINVIGERAFEGCDNIKEVIFAQNSSIRIIEDRAFAGCLMLEIFNMGDNYIQEIGDYAFYECLRLKNAEFPATLTYLGEGAYSNSGIKYVHFSDNSQLKIINQFTFNDCRNLVAFNFGEHGVLEIIAESAFKECTNLRSVLIPLSNRLLTTIGAEVFYNCGSLTNIELPTSLMDVGDDAFVNVPYVESSSELLMTVGSVVLRYLGDDTEIVISDEIAAISKWAFKDNTSIKKITFTENSQLFAIGEEAFMNCINLEDINLPLSITYVGNNAFTNTKWLDRYTDEFVIINDILIKYRGDAYQAIIPENVTVIGIEAFEGNTKLRNIVVNKNVKSIMARAFDNMGENSTITMLPVLPPQLDEDNEIISLIYVEDISTFNTYREHEVWSMYVTDVQQSVVTKYRVTFNLGRFNESYGQQDLSVLFEEPTPYMEGYTFIGWYEVYNSEDGPNAPGAYENLITLPYTLTENTILYAKWIHNQIGTISGDFRVTTIDGDEDRYIIEYTGLDKFVMIPAVYSEQTIVGISKKQAVDSATGWPLVDEQGNPIYDGTAFSNNTVIEEVVFIQGYYDGNVYIPGSQMRYIMDGAFENCTNLRRIVLPSTIEYIGKNAFANCVNLEEIIFTGGGVVDLDIDDSAFYGCTSLETITFEANLRKIGVDAFRDCTALNRIYLKGENPPHISDNPFEIHSQLRIYVQKRSDDSIINAYKAHWSDYELYITDEED